MESSRTERMKRLIEARPLVAPSMLMCDFGHLAEEVAQLEVAGFEALHLDVMDGVFVDNLSYGLPLVSAFRQLTDLPLDVHLMIANPEKYVARYIEAGSDFVTIHWEATDDAAAVLQEIRRLGAGAGLAINPDTPVEAIEACLPHCDLVLVMSVQPGFGGQSFDERALPKLRALQDKVGAQVVLAIDGGVNQKTIADCAAAGASLFVVGSGVFRADDYTAARVALDALIVEGRDATPSGN